MKKLGAVLLLALLMVPVLAVPAAAQRGSYPGAGAAIGAARRPWCSWRPRAAMVVHGFRGHNGHGHHGHGHHTATGAITATRLRLRLGYGAAGFVFGLGAGRAPDRAVLVSPGLRLPGLLSDLLPRSYYPSVLDARLLLGAGLPIRPRPYSTPTYSTPVYTPPASSSTYPTPSLAARPGTAEAAPAPQASAGRHRPAGAAVRDAGARRAPALDQHELPDGVDRGALPDARHAGRPARHGLGAGAHPAALPVADPASVQLRDEGPVRVLTLNRPAVHNCVDGDTAARLGAAIEAFAADGLGPRPRRHRRRPAGVLLGRRPEGDRHPAGPSVLRARGPDGLRAARSRQADDRRHQRLLLRRRPRAGRLVRRADRRRHRGVRGAEPALGRAVRGRRHPAAAAPGGPGERALARRVRRAHRRLAARSRSAWSRRWWRATTRSRAPSSWRTRSPTYPQSSLPGRPRGRAGRLGPPPRRRPPAGSRRRPAHGRRPGDAERPRPLPLPRTATRDPV